MPTPSQLDLTAAQINTALNNAWDSDQQPALGQANLCNGDKIATAIATSVGAVSSDVATLAGRVTTLETTLEPYATFTKLSYSIGSGSQTISGYTEVDADNIASELSGVITLTAGVYQVSFVGVFTSTHNDDSTISAYVGSSVVSSILIKAAGVVDNIAASLIVQSSGSQTLKITSAGAPSNNATCPYTVISIRKIA
jgi:hypothetical protein